MATPAMAYIISQFGPSEYLGGTQENLDMMEQNLGIAGSAIEDFDDSTLLPGLTISGPPYGASWGNTWGDPNTDASVMVFPKPADPAIISISSGVNLIGIGIGWMEYVGTIGGYSIMTINDDISIDITPTNFPDFVFGVIARNGYITIKTEENDELIKNIKFYSTEADGDAYSFDYIALNTNPVPIPGAAWLLGSGIIGVVGIRLRSKSV